MSVKVCKFGGTSMADGAVIRQVAQILAADPARRYVVVSAPGKRYSADIKITDLLYRCFDEVQNGNSCHQAFVPVRARFVDICKQLSVDLDIEEVLNQTERRIDEEKSRDFTASRGEYLCARVVAAYLGATFIDSEDVVFFTENGMLDDAKTYRAVAEAVHGQEMAVFPGFYGKDVYGKVKTFSRGGSDISGSIVARAVGATLYENWTDVSGFLACDPRIVNSPKQIKCLTYKELRELSYMGANVLHSESIFPVRKAGIPIAIKNTFRPEDEGTLIMPISRYTPSGSVVTGVAGKKDFTVIYIEKSLMNVEIGFVRKVLSVLERFNVSFEHVPTGIDTMSIILESAQLQEYRMEQLIECIKEEVDPDIIRVSENMALVATVGHGLSSSIATAARLFTALHNAGVNVKLIDESSGELNIIVGVKNDEYEKTVSAIYHEFFA